MEGDNLHEDDTQGEYAQGEDAQGEYAQGEDAQDDSKIIEPQCGMVFPSESVVFDFWKAYGSSVGYPVRRRGSKKENGVKVNIRLMCSLGGKSSEERKTWKLQPHTRLGCPVCLTACLGNDGQWHITKVCLEHNHPVSPSKKRYFPCNRGIPNTSQRRLELNDRSGIRVNQNIRACIDEVGGYENSTFTTKDARNHVDKSRHLRLGEGDAMAIHKYFLEMQIQNPGFRFSMDLDEDGRLQNVFWADTRSIEAYKEFGRVVSFDATYLVNKYDMPFAPFVGVNHHGQSVLLGCGLVSSEDTATYCWLFRTWLTCMSGCAPEGIITDQCRAMQNAIQIVFPNTRHRWCLWHITRKFGQKFVGYDSKAAIIFDLQGAIYDSQTPLEFEQSWNSMLSKFNLQENEWLSDLYDERQRWIPCFVKSSYWAGMSTTQRSESINAFFDGYVHSNTSLKQFVEQYGNALRSKVEKETEADYRSLTQMKPVATHWTLEKQFQSLYTLSKFEEFQDEVRGKQYCGFVSTKQCDLGFEWVVVEHMFVGDGRKKRVNFTVLVSDNQDGCDLKCTCRLFQFRGILCRHVMFVFLTIYGDVELPEKYIFSTWRKDVKRCHSRVKITYDGWVGTTEQNRYEKLCTQFTKVAIVGAEDENRSKEVVDFLECLQDHLSKLPPASTSVQTTSSSGQPESMNDQNEIILDPICKRSKGRPPVHRKMSMFETIVRKKKAALNTNEQSNEGGESSQSITKKKQAKGRNKRHIVVQVNQTQEPSISQVCTQESVASSVHHTHEFPLGMNMNLSLGVPPQISQNPMWYNMYSTPTGYAPTAFVQSSGYVPTVMQQVLQQQQYEVQQQQVQQQLVRQQQQLQQQQVQQQLVQQQIQAQFVQQSPARGATYTGSSNI